MTYHYRSIPSQLDRRLLSVNGLSPWDGYTASSRKQMFSSHIAQRLVIKGATERYCQTGMEREFGKYTFALKIPVNAQIIQIIDRYPETIDKDAIRYNPQSLIVYEDVDTKEISVLSIPKFCSYHQYFGFEYKAGAGLSKIRAEAFVPAGEILVDTPAKTDDGGYMYGAECNIAYMSLPGVAEDGIVISRQALHKFAYKIYESRSVEWGSKKFPLNLYGDENNYKPFPDIGEYVREDSIICALRSHNKNTAMMDQSIYALMKPDATYDSKTYASRSGGRIVDIKVQHDQYSAPASTPQGMEVQPEKYDKARRKFHQEILNVYERLRRKHGVNLQLSHEFHRMIVESMGVIKNDDTLKIQKLYRKTPLDDWRIEFIIEHEIVPDIGSKLTDTFGGKGVVCQIRDESEMPVDEHGNRAEMVFYGNSTVNRMNLGRKFEHYINAASRDCRKAILRQLMTLAPHAAFNNGVTLSMSGTITHDEVNTILASSAKDHQLLNKLNKLEMEYPAIFNTAWEYLMGYYQIVVPKQYNWFQNGTYQHTRAEHLMSVLKKGIYLYMPPDRETEDTDVVRELQAKYRPVYGPVTYVGNSGKTVTTKKPVRIGSQYIMLLEKTGDDWTAVASAKTQINGVLAQITNADKYSQSWRNQAIRAYGESEVRILVSYVGPRVTADLLDRNNNPEAHKAMLYAILQAPCPTNIKSSVDRKKVPMGGSKPLQLVNHILECGGTRFKYTPYRPLWVNPNVTVLPAPIVNRSDSKGIQ